MLLSQNYLGIAGTGGPPAPPSVPLEYVGKVQDAVNSRTSYNWGSVSCGATGPNRTMLFILVLENTASTPFTTPTVQIDGNVVAADRSQNLQNGAKFVGIYRARPTGATCQIQITDFGTDADNNVIYVYRADALIGLYDRTIYNYQQTTNASTILRRTLGLPANGFMIGCAGLYHLTNTLSLTFGDDITTTDDSATDTNSISYAFSYDNDGLPDDSIVFSALPSDTARRSIIGCSYYYQSSPPAKINKSYRLLGWQSAGAAPRTLRVRVPASLGGIADLAGTNRLQLRFTPALTSSATTIQIDKCYIGHAAPSGDLYDAADLTQVLFGGGATLNVSSSTVAGLESDPVAFSYDGTSDLILSFLINTSAAVIPTGGATGGGVWHASGDNAATLNVSGFTSIATDAFGMMECIRGWVEP
jgi:hypothetical protein